MKCIACNGDGGWETPSMLISGPPHYDRCVRCNGSGNEPGIERLGVDLDSLVGFPD
jgi:hypothetical protein